MHKRGGRRIYCEEDKLSEQSSVSIMRQKNERMVYMDLKINRETVRSLERICDSTQEQSVELDYVLPDYYPEIFRIIRCTAEPRITSCAVSGDKAAYELTVCIKVIYCSEKGSLQAVDQKLSYSRTVNLEGRCLSPTVDIRPFADHINCRAVNRRRIDVRGAVTIRISAFGEKETPVVSDAFGSSIQLKKMVRSCPSDYIRVQKRAAVSDEFELGGAPPIGNILRSSADIISSGKKMIGSKAAAKGELKISLLYTPSGESEEKSVNSMQFSMPFSQLVDMEGMDDTYDCRVDTEVISCDISPRSEGDGDVKSVECEVMLLITCTAVKCSVYEIAADEYSTAFATSHTEAPVRISGEPLTVDTVTVIKGVCENKDSPLSVIYDAWCSAERLTAAANDGAVSVTGSVRISVLGKTESGDHVICETDVSVDEAIPVENKRIGTDADIRIGFSVLSCTYTISSDNTAEVKAEIGIRGTVTDCETINAITEITVDEDSPREKNEEYALRLYFAHNGEELWDIAKRYGASIDQVMEENELEDTEAVKEGRMLLIPIN